MKFGPAIEIAWQSYDRDSNCDIGKDSSRILRSDDRRQLVGKIDTNILDRGSRVPENCPSMYSFSCSENGPVLISSCVFWAFQAHVLVSAEWCSHLHLPGTGFSHIRLPAIRRYITCCRLLIIKSFPKPRRCPICTIFLRLPIKKTRSLEAWEELLALCLHGPSTQ